MKFSAWMIGAIAAPTTPPRIFPTRTDPAKKGNRRLDCSASYRLPA
jgi:hypothetical protein